MNIGYPYHEQYLEKENIVEDCTGVKILNTSSPIISHIQYYAIKPVIFENRLRY